MSILLSTGPDGQSCGASPKDGGLGRVGVGERMGGRVGVKPAVGVPAACGEVEAQDTRTKMRLASIAPRESNLMRFI